VKESSVLQNNLFRVGALPSKQYIKNMLIDAEFPQSGKIKN